MSVDREMLDEAVKRHPAIIRAARNARSLSHIDDWLGQLARWAITAEYRRCLGDRAKAAAVRARQ